MSWAGLDAGVNLRASVAAHQGDDASMRALLDRHIAPHPAPPPPSRADGATAVATAATTYPTPLSEARSHAQPPYRDTPATDPRRADPRRAASKAAKPRPAG